MFGVKHLDHASPPCLDPSPVAACPIYLLQRKLCRCCLLHIKGMPPASHKQGLFLKCAMASIWTQTTLRPFRELLTGQIPHSLSNHFYFMVDWLVPSFHAIVAHSQVARNAWNDEVPNLEKFNVSKQHSAKSEPRFWPQNSPEQHFSVFQHPNETRGSFCSPSTFFTLYLDDLQWKEERQIGDRRSHRLMAKAGTESVYLQPSVCQLGTGSEHYGYF